MAPRRPVARGPVRGGVTAPISLKETPASPYGNFSFSYPLIRPAADAGQASAGSRQPHTPPPRQLLAQSVAEAPKNAGIAAQQR